MDCCSFSCEQGYHLVPALNFTTTDQSIFIPQSAQRFTHTNIHDLTQLVRPAGQGSGHQPGRPPQNITSHSLLCSAFIF